MTRLKVSGFKNLVDTDVYFGPFTCIAGPNGVGKSNLFDAIRFLSALADRTFVDAAKSVRDESGRTGDIRALFNRTGEHVADRMSFEAEMIVPQSGTDDLGQLAQAKATFLRYAIELGLRADETASGNETLELFKEELTHIKGAEAKEALRFPFEPEWRKSVIKPTNRNSPFISTEGKEGDRKVCEHQEGVQGRTRNRPARQLPRTVLSATNASESPTALLARREMQSWRLLQLEPTALRKPDEFSALPRLGSDGSHLPAALYRLARGGKNAQLYNSVAMRLQELIRDIQGIAVDRDEKRELLTLLATDRSKTQFPARALSDGTLRFLALTVLELDPEVVGVICFEEPENGIHPERIPAMLRLLKGIAVDTALPVGDDNPLRQVIVNTHSPVVVGEIEDDDLLGADVREASDGGRLFRKVVFQCLPETWRAGLEPAPQTLPKGALLAYLNPVPDRVSEPTPQPGTNGHARSASRKRRVRDRPDIRSLFDE